MWVSILTPIPVNPEPHESPHMETSATSSIPAPKSAQKFAKVYGRGWKTIAEIGLKNRTALQIYSFIAEHCDHLNALVCPVEVVMEELGMSRSTVSRGVKWLHDNKHLTIIKVGSINAYVLDYRDIWKNYDEYKRYCAFGAKTLVSKAQNRDLKTRLTMMMEGQRDLFDASADPETGEVN